MDLWDSYNNKRGADFGAKRLLLDTGQRWNASLGQISDRAVYLDLNHVIFHAYSEAKRYVLCRNISFDLLLTAYEVNTRNFFGMRPTKEVSGEEWHQIRAWFEKLKRPNLEFRAIGMQNDYRELEGNIDGLRRTAKGRFMEIDVFGNETRHIAIDLKTGASYNLLLENRIYRQGELMDLIKSEEYATMRSELLFVKV